MVRLFDWLKIGGGAASGAIAMFGLMSAYDAIWDDPAVKREIRQIVEAESAQATKESIDGVSDLAERARAMRRYCSERGRLYDFAANQCREG